MRSEFLYVVGEFLHCSFFFSQSGLDEAQTKMSDNSAPQVEKKEEETKAVVEEKKVEEVKEEKKAEEPAKEEKKEEEKKAEPKPASSASATDETPDVNTSEEYKTNEEGEDVLYGTYVADGRRKDSICIFSRSALFEFSFLRGCNANSRALSIPFEWIL